MEVCDSISCIGNLKWFLNDSASNKPIFNSNDEIAYLEVESLTGFCGFDIFEYYPICTEGIFYGSTHNALNLHKIPIASSSYYTITNLQDQIIDNTTIDVYSKPDTLSSKKTILLKTDKVVKFFEVIEVEKQNSSISWIHVRIIGYEGYILMNDLEKLGFMPR